MCSVIILFQPTQSWPVVIAANRDEMTDRPWLPPARHWTDRPYVVGGMDQLAGGSWMGINDYGVVAAILNREGTLGPQTGKRSRGELVLEALDHNDALVAVEALADLDGRAYRGFNMVVADNCMAYWVRADGGPKVRIQAIEPGVHMLTARDLDDESCPRIHRFLPQFRAALLPAPQTDDWGHWPELLAATEGDNPMSFLLPSGFGTVSSSLLALPSLDLIGKQSGILPKWRFTEGPPHKTLFRAVSLG